MKKTDSLFEQFAVCSGDRSRYQEFVYASEDSGDLFRVEATVRNHVGELAVEWVE